jgi:electron transport complex protein RnfC
MTEVLTARYRAKGGVHPPYHKQLAADKAIRTMPVPPRLRVSLLQHLGAPARPLVKKGDTVRRGQKIAEPGGFVSVSYHAPTSGAVTAVEEADTASGLRAIHVEITADGRDQWAAEIVPHPEWEQLDPRALVSLIAEAGICGMGGAGFPTHVKLSPPPGKKIGTLLINGAECEPFLTADHRLMVEHAREIWTGARILQRILEVKTVRVAIEDNKPDAIAAMRDAMAGAADSAVLALKTRYPQGAEKQQIFAALGREVPSGGLPMDVAALVENVGTACAVYDAVVNGRPLTERITTVTGRPVASPGNLRVRIGTPYADLLAFCGGTTGPVGKVISGGPMMGFAQHSLDVTVSKTASGLVWLTPGECAVFSSLPCISCGRCVTACPMSLTPCEISRMVEAEDYGGAEEWDVMDCIECGACAYECPAGRPLVQHMKQAKARVMLKRQKDKEKEKEKEKQKT